jgi:Invasion associated locus B (IalB) protein
VALGGSCGYGDAMRGARNRISFLIWLSLLASLSNPAASAKKTDAAQHVSSTSASQRLGTADAWTAYAYTEKSGKVCYLAGGPQKVEPAAANRKMPMLMVTHRPKENIANVVNFIEGYPLKEGSDVVLDVGGTKFDLFTKGDSAWASTAELDKTIVEAMTKAKQVVVKGVPRKGQGTTDTYSLTGFAQVLTLIDKACDIKR